MDDALADDDDRDSGEDNEREGPRPGEGDAEASEEGCRISEDFSSVLRGGKSDVIGLSGRERDGRR